MYSGGGALSEFWQNPETVFTSFLPFPRKWLFFPRHGACGAALFKSPFRSRAPTKIFWGVQTVQMDHLNRLDPPEYFFRRARAKRRFEQCRAARGVGGKFVRISQKSGFPKISKSQNSQGMDPGSARFRAWRMSCRAFRWVKRGPDAQNLLRRVCFSPEKAKRGR